MINSRNRKFENSNYLDFIRRLPCAITGICGDDIHSHHVSGKGKVINDYMTVPLKYNQHFQGISHITENQLATKINENPLERIILYMSLYIQMLEGKYDPEMDMETNFLTLRMKLEGRG